MDDRMVGIVLLGMILLFVWGCSQNRKGEKTDYTKKISLTKLFFVLTNACAIIWVFISYGIAIYSTIHLEQVYTMAELSEPAINTVLGVTTLKVVENIFEHNDSWLFGHKKGENDDD